MAIVAGRSPLVCDGGAAGGVARVGGRGGSWRGGPGSGDPVDAGGLDQPATGNCPRHHCRQRSPPVPVVPQGRRERVTLDARSWPVAGKVRQAPIERAEFRHLGQQDAAEHRRDAGNGREQAGDLLPRRGAADAGIGIGDDHDDALAPPGDQPGRRVALGIARQGEGMAHGQDMHVEPVLGGVDTDEDRGSRRRPVHLPSSRMRARDARATVRDHGPVGRWGTALFRRLRAPRRVRFPTRLRTARTTKPSR